MCRLLERLIPLIYGVGKSYPVDLGHSKVSSHASRTTAILSSSLDHGIGLSNSVDV